MPRRLRLWLPILFASLLLGCGGQAAPIVVTPSTYDFGRVLKGDQPDHVFQLTNHSDRVVSFKAQPNCACFAVAQGLRPLDPGQSLEFRVLFDTTALPAQKVKSKYITIHTDHPDVSGIVVPLQGEIYRAYTLGPDHFPLGKIDGRARNYEARTVNIRPLEGHTVRFLGSFQMPPIFDVETIRRPKGGLDVHIALQEEARRPLGPFRAKIRLDLEVVSEAGAVRKEERIIELQGLWVLRP